MNKYLKHLLKFIVNKNDYIIYRKEYLFILKLSKIKWMVLIFLIKFMGCTTAKERIESRMVTLKLKRVAIKEEKKILSYMND